LKRIAPDSSITQNEGTLRALPQKVRYSTSLATKLGFIGLNASLVGGNSAHSAQTGEAEKFRDDSSELNLYTAKSGPIDILDLHMTLAPNPLQPYLLIPQPLTDAVEELSHAGGIEQRGAVFTRREVVDFILDLVGYRSTADLVSTRLLEPAFGNGEFILAALERLLTARAAKKSRVDGISDLISCIRGVELHKETFGKTRERVLEALELAFISKEDAVELADAWLSSGDFLLEDLSGGFDFVVGNPPYVRQELIPAPLLIEYRRRYTTVYDRADLYVPFIEKSLRLLAPGGSLSFICADRWMKNKYGGPLRKLVSDDFHLRAYVDMTGAPAFQSDVIAYPAITVITREKAGATRVARRPVIDRESLARLANSLTRERPIVDDPNVKEVVTIASGTQPWLLESSDQMLLLRRLERDFPDIQQAACKVGIGVATGADSVYIGRFDELDVEPSRKLPLAMTGDIQSGVVAWRGYGVINPFNDDGSLVKLAEYPNLQRYLEAYRTEVSARHCARKIPENWYRTIDRITPSLAAKPKLLIPDIKGGAQVVYEGGRLYPHHNLYYIASNEWDLHALQAVLLSGIARLFVGAYSTKMRGGYLRFQAQYLRRIRLPLWSNVPNSFRKDLTKAAELRDVNVCNEAVFNLFNLSKRERASLASTTA
jgi:hypothetical protein